MIPYDELCSALARWRERNGLLNGPSAVPPQGAILTPPPPAPVAAAPAPAPVPAPVVAADDSAGDLVFSASVSTGFGDSVPTEEHPADPPTTITRSPYEPEETIVHEDEDLDAPTGLHFTPEAIPAGRDVTNEIDIDDLGDPDDDSKRYKNN